MKRCFCSVCKEKPYTKFVGLEKNGKVATVTVLNKDIEKAMEILALTNFKVLVIRPDRERITHRVAFDRRQWILRGI